MQTDSASSSYHEGHLLPLLLGDTERNFRYSNHHEGKLIKNIETTRSTEFGIEAWKCEGRKELHWFSLIYTVIEVNNF